MPIHMRLPKRGFKAINPKSYTVVNLRRLQTEIDAGKLNAKSVITADVLVEAGIVRRKKDGVRILGNGEIKAKVTLEVEGASKSAVAAVEKAGGKVVLPQVSEMKKEAKPKGKSREKTKEAKPAKEETAPEEDKDQK